MLMKWLEFGDRFEIDDETRKRLNKVYPFFEQELIKMEMWYIANPAKRKKNVYRFMVNWLNKKLEQVNSAPKAFVKDYKKDSEEFKKKIEDAKQECAPPPQCWSEMLAKLKRGSCGN